MNSIERRVRQRAEKLWEGAGRPPGGADAYLDQASELIAIEDNQKQATRPLKPHERAAPEEDATLAPDESGPSGEPVEPIESLDNTGEYPTLTDQGEESAPRRRPVRTR